MKEEIEKPEFAQETEQLPPLRKRLIELFLATLKIGITSFGAPTAHIAMMEREFVRKRKWLSQEVFLDLLSAANLIPGPNASETCYHVGYIRAGYPGLLVAGIGFISPAFIISMVVAYFYMAYGSLPQIESIFYILNPLVLAIVLETTLSLGKSSLKGWKQILIFGLAIIAKLLGVDEALILIGGGFVGVLLHHVLEKAKNGQPPTQLLMSMLPIPGMSTLLVQAVEKVQATFSNLFLYFLRTGSVLFGSSLVLFALIEEDVVNRFGWLTSQQLTDAIALGQIVPGPVLSASTFIGYIAGGPGGAVAATLGVFLPSFIIVAITAPLVNKLRENHLTGSFLKGINPAVIAMILFVCINLGQNALVDIWTWLAMFAGFALLLFTEAQPYVLILVGFAIGILRIVF